MKRFNYKLPTAIITILVIGLVLCSLMTIFSVFKLFNLFNLTSSSLPLDVTTIVLSALLATLLLMVKSLRYIITPNGIKLVLGFIQLKKQSFSTKDISAIVYKTKQNQLLIVKDISSDKTFGSIVNIPSSQFNDFVKALIDNKISFDYIEDID